MGLQRCTCDCQSMNQRPHLPRSLFQLAYYPSLFIFTALFSANVLAVLDAFINEEDGLITVRNGANAFTDKEQ